MPASAVRFLGAAILHRRRRNERAARSLQHGTGMHEAAKEFSFELVKRDGRREQYDRAKLVRSLMRAGVAPYMLVGILDTVTPNPGQDTGSLRADIAAELEYWHPNAARRYATTRSLIVRASNQAGYGWVCLNPETVNRLGLKPGDTVWLGDRKTPAPFSVESHQDVEPGQARLNAREMMTMGVAVGTKLAASSVYHQSPSLPEATQVTGRARVTAAAPGGMAGRG
jgi:hypothetical protein